MNDRPIYRIHHLTERYDVCRATIYNWIARGEFPKPIRLGRNSVGWTAEQIREHEKPQAA